MNVGSTEPDRSLVRPSYSSCFNRSVTFFPPSTTTFSNLVVGSVSTSTV